MLRSVSIIWKLAKDSHVYILLELPLSLAFSLEKHMMSNHLFSVIGNLLKAWEGNGCSELVTYWYLERVGNSR